MIQPVTTAAIVRTVNQTVCATLDQAALTGRLDNKILLEVAIVVGGDNLDQWTLRRTNHIGESLTLYELTEEEAMNIVEHLQNLPQLPEELS